MDNDVLGKNITLSIIQIGLKELAKEFRKLNGTKMPAKIILIGGAAILANYGFRDLKVLTEKFVQTKNKHGKNAGRTKTGAKQLNINE